MQKSRKKRKGFNQRLWKFFFITAQLYQTELRLPRLNCGLNLIYITAQIDPNKIMDYPGFTVELSEDLVDVSIVYSAICD